MTVKQWAGAGAAGVLMICIYLLPQTVVQNANKQLAATAAAPATTTNPAPGQETNASAGANGSAAAEGNEPEHFEGDGHDHSDGHQHGQQRINLPASAQTHIQSLKESASKTGDKEKFAIFADSLAANWAKWAWHDSAAYWAEQAVTAKPTIARRFNAGNFWFEALQQASDPAQQRLYGERAAGHLNKVLEQDPNRSDAQIKLALTHVVSDKPMEGILLLRKVLEREPRNTDALYHMGVLSFQSNQYDKAVQRFEDLLKVDAKHKEGHFYLALSYTQLGNNAKAREHLLAVRELETDPNVKADIDGYLKDLK